MYSLKLKDTWFNVPEDGISYDPLSNITMKSIFKAILLALSLYVVASLFLFSVAAIDKIFGYKAVLSALILLVLTIDISGLTFLFYRKV